MFKKLRFRILNIVSNFMLRISNFTCYSRYMRKSYLYGFWISTACFCNVKSGMTIGAILLSLLFVHPVFAQTPSNYSDAFLQYNLKTEDYNKAHDTYVVKRSAYLKFKTLQSEKEAKDATVLMLQTRDDVVIAYLTAVSLKMTETKGIPDAERSANQKLIADEIAFFKDHKTKIPSAGTLQDLANDSKLAAERYTLDTKNFFYKMLFSISNGKVLDLRTRLGTNLTNVKTKVNAIRDETRPEYQFSAEKISAIDRFVFESENKFARADEKEALALETKNLREFTGDEYLRRLSTLSEMQQLLKEASSFLKEIINQIKSQ
jgi:hypothetical protein